jgi:hypothetical protein
VRRGSSRPHPRQARSRAVGERRGTHRPTRRRGRGGGLVASGEGHPRRTKAATHEAVGWTTGKGRL